MISLFIFFLCFRVRWLFMVLDGLFPAHQAVCKGSYCFMKGRGLETLLCGLFLWGNALLLDTVLLSTIPPVDK